MRSTKSPVVDFITLEKLLQNPMPTRSNIHYQSVTLPSANINLTPRHSSVSIQLNVLLITLLYICKLLLNISILAAETDCTVNWSTLIPRSVNWHLL